MSPLTIEGLAIATLFSIGLMVVLYHWVGYSYNNPQG